MHEERLAKLQKICRYARYVSAAVLILFLVIAAAFVGTGCLCILDPGFNLTGWTHDQACCKLVLGIAAVFCLLLMMFCVYRLLHSLENESTPFTRGNVRLLRLMSLILFAEWFFLLFLEVILIGVIGLDSDYDIDYEVLVFGAICYVLSLIFQYGVELQDESDGFL